jgi:hypothetical protein
MANLKTQNPLPFYSFITKTKICTMFNNVISDETQILILKQSSSTLP